MMSDSQKGFTLVELLILLTIVSVLGLIVLSALAGADAKARRLTCVENLKEVSRLFFQYSETRGHFPTFAPPNSSSSAAELLSQRISAGATASPEVVQCPSDNRTPSSSWEMLAMDQISYFFNLEAAPENPESLLAGDRNLFRNGVPVSGVVTFNDKELPEWGRDLHSTRGNILKADGTVEFVSSRALKSLLFKTPGRLSFPAP